jgi:hypothetical protein
MLDRFFTRRNPGEYCEADVPCKRAGGVPKLMLIHAICGLWPCL